jgi:two-component system, cell cycle sensor histidine kinase PleC
LHLSGHAHATDDGQASGVIGCARDCTAERQTLLALTARDAAERASRSKSAFLSRMSHELRTPLNAILGFSQLMRMDAEDGNLVLKPQRAAMIETAARHLLDLVNEVLDVSQIESGRVTVTLTDFDLHDVVRESMAMVKTAADAADIRLSDELPVDRPCPVRGDRLRLKEVLINLLSNAVKYNLPHGEVVVAAHDTGTRMEVHVTDNGPGLSDTQLSGLFEPFNRAGAENSGIEGSGMGLYVSRRFAELMDATLTVQTDVGRGCRFIVSLRRGAA